ncbi:MAG: hypothetical protein AAGI72_23610 [Pseudomonadota bacterium]
MKLIANEETRALAIDTLTARIRRLRAGFPGEEREHLSGTASRPNEEIEQCFKRIDIIRALG